MRLFVSYARVDKPYCLQIIDMLDVHEVWYDERLFAGQQWWKEILRRLDWCQVFIYLLSPVSIASEYCRKEYSIAHELNKHIIPVLIDDQTPIPSDLQQLQYVDLSKGITPEAVKALLNALHRVERDGSSQRPQKPVADIREEVTQPPALNPATVVADAAYALETGDYDRAVFLLGQAIDKGIKSRFIDLDALLHEAEVALERTTYLAEAAREYKQIAALIKHKRTHHLGCEAFRAFRKQYPNYDPENLSQACIEFESPGGKRALPEQKPEFDLPMLEWCDIPAGMVTLETGNKNGTGSWQTLYVDSFKMSKYPVTNRQYQEFIQDSQGYGNPEWWNYSTDAREWRMKTTQPKQSRFKGDERPRENVTWYEALAFCNWLSAKTGLTITLPTEQQWQRAAQGDNNFLYPWGNKFDMRLCNTRESRIRMTTAVTRYPDGVNAYGVFDLAGNVWEWCLTAEDGPAETPDITTSSRRAVHGGSFIGESHRAQSSFRFFLEPVYYYATIGFRIVQITTKS